MPNGNPAPGPLNSRYFRPVRGKETRARRWDQEFESPLLQRRVNELSVPLDEGVFEPPDLLQTRMNGGDQIVVEADQILRRPRAAAGQEPGPTDRE